MGRGRRREKERAGKEREGEGGKREGRRGERVTCNFVFLGCMAERLKEKVLETNKQVDIIAGPGEALNHTHQLHPPPQTRTATYPDYWR